MFQPVICERHYKMGWHARNRGEFIQACQERLDNTQGLESDQYDSFWAGYHDCDRWLAGGETNGAFIEARLASIMALDAARGRGVTNAARPSAN